jgi:hypothetical protein
MIDMLSSTAAISHNWSRFVPFFSLSSETMYHHCCFQLWLQGHHDQNLDLIEQISSFTEKLPLCNDL